MPASLRTRVKSQTTALDTRHAKYNYESKYKRSSSVWPMLILLALWSSSSDADEREIKALRDEVSRLQQTLTADEQQFVNDVALKEGYMTEEYAPSNEATISTVDSLAAGTAPAQEQQAEEPKTGIAKLASNEDPVQAMFDIMSKVAPLMFLMLAISFIRKVFNDR